MNLPWDKSYFKLCFYIIFTFIVIYIVKNAIDMVVYGIFNMGGVYRTIIDGIGSTLSVFSVIIIGFIIAYILNPLVEFLTSHNIKRGLSVMAAFFMLLVILIFIVLAVILSITEFGKYSIADGFNIQISNFNSNINIVDKYISKYTDIKRYRFSLDEIFIYKCGKYITQIFLGTIISIYFLKDKDKIISNLVEYKSLIPKKLADRLSYILINLNKAFSGYVRGQLTDAVIMASLLSFSLSVVKVPFSIPIGILSGFLNIIPYFGAVFGFAVAVGSAILSGKYMNALYAGIVIFVIQQFDSVYISPKIVGERTRLSPVAVIVALAVASNMFGLWGMIFAVPVTAFLKNIIRDYMLKKENNIESN